MFLLSVNLVLRSKLFYESKNNRINMGLDDAKIGREKVGVGTQRVRTRREETFRLVFFVC